MRVIQPVVRPVEQVLSFYQTKGAQLHVLPLNIVQQTTLASTVQKIVTRALQLAALFVHKVTI
jgi:hypothetical protein